MEVRGRRHRAAGDPSRLGVSLTEVAEARPAAAGWEHLGEQVSQETGWLQSLEPDSNAPNASRDWIWGFQMGQFPVTASAGMSSPMQGMGFYPVQNELAELIGTRGD